MTTTTRDPRIDPRRDDALDGTGGTYIVRDNDGETVTYWSVSGTKPDTLSCSLTDWRADATSDTVTHIEGVELTDSQRDAFDASVSA